MDTKAVIFDMDGVLIDSRELHYQAWRITGEKYGFAITPDKYGQYFGQTSVIFAEAICRENGVECVDEVIEEWLERKEKCYREQFKKYYTENKLLSKLLLNLQNNGFKTGVGSSAPASNIQDLVDIMPHGELLKEFVSGDDVTEGKPNPEVFIMAAAKLGVLANRCAVIEDSIHGLKAAKLAGMVAIAITSTHDKESLLNYADLVIDELDEVDADKISALIEQL